MSWYFLCAARPSFLYLYSFFCNNTSSLEQNYGFNLTLVHLYFYCQVVYLRMPSIDIWLKIAWTARRLKHASEPPFSRMYYSHLSHRNSLSDFCVHETKYLIVFIKTIKHVCFQSFCLDRFNTHYWHILKHVTALAVIFTFVAAIWERMLPAGDDIKDNPAINIDQWLLTNFRLSTADFFNSLSDKCFSPAWQSLVRSAAPLPRSSLDGFCFIFLKKILALLQNVETELNQASSLQSMIATYKL